MASNPNYCDITPEIEALAAQSLQNSSIDAGDYVKSVSYTHLTLPTT